MVRYPYLITLLYQGSVKLGGHILTNSPVKGRDMDHSYIVKIKVIFILDIKTPISTWILARLFDEELPLGEKDLLRKLCQASFDSMNADNDFDNAITALRTAGYIEHGEKEYRELVPLRNNSLLTVQETGMHEVTRKRTGFSITKAGIIAFRRQIATPIEKIVSNVNKLDPSKTSPFKKILNELNSHRSILEASIALAIENAPHILEFIKNMAHQLALIGITVPLTS